MKSSIRVLLLLASFAQPTASVLAQGLVGLPQARPPLPGAFEPRTIKRAVAEAIQRDPALVASPYTLLVRFRPNTPEANKSALRALVGRGRLHAFTLVPDLEVIEIRGLSVTEACSRLSPHVLYAEPDYVVRASQTPDDLRFAEQWGLHNVGQSIGQAGTPDADIDAPETWRVTTGDSQFVIAVVDTGIDKTHPDLVQNLWVNPGEIPGNGIDDDGNEIVDDVHGADMRDDDGSPDDVDDNPDDDKPAGHGTHVAGTIGARGNNGIGVSGVLQRCRIMSLRFMGPLGGLNSDSIRGLEYAVRKGARVSNHSYGGTTDSPSQRDAFAAAGDAGHLCICAAGNDSSDNDASAQFPANYTLANIISVASLENTDLMRSTSNFGRVSVDLGAPGGRILATVPGGGYDFKSGTSMAAPFVTGAAALVWIRNPSFSVAEVKHRLLSRVRKIAALDGKCVSGGALNLLDALRPSAPSLWITVEGTYADPEGLRIRWSRNGDDADAFEVERQIGAQSTIRVFLASKTSYVDVPPTFLPNLRYRIRAVNGAGKSNWSGWRTVY